MRRELTDHEKKALALLRAKKSVEVITLIREMVALAELLEITEMRPYEKAMLKHWKQNDLKLTNTRTELVEHFGLEELVKGAVLGYPD
jgi:hypothetical protein